MSITFQAKEGSVLQGPFELQQLCSLQRRGALPAEEDQEDEHREVQTDASQLQQEGGRKVRRQRQDEGERKPILNLT